jgi:DNA polymerase-1
VNYFIVDAMNLAFRAHSVFFENKTTKGTPSGMFYGFITILQSLKKKYRGYKFVVVWDNKPTWKYDIHPEYKTGRTKLSPLVTPQIQELRKFLSYCDVNQYEKIGEEADDVIASLVEKFKKEPETKSILVYSNDKDLLQLVDGSKVVVFKPKVGTSLEKFYDYEAVKNRFGVPPEKLVNFRCFDGDSSDTLPGVDRVRRKKIAACVCSSKDVEDFFNVFMSSDMSDNEKEKLALFKDQALNNYKLMSLNKSLNDIHSIDTNPSVEGIEGMLAEYEIKKIDAESILSLFQSSLNIRYTDARPSYVLESVSLFND